jgi:hypothetical protein
MTRGILIVGNDSGLFTAIAGEAAKRVERFAAAVIPNHFAGSGGEAVAYSAADPAGQISLPWNPGSPVSARGLVLAAENRLEHIDEAVLVCVPPAVYRSAAALVPGEIETMANDYMKGWFFLVRELALIFRGRKEGVLTLVVPETAAGGGRDAVPDLLGASAAASFRAFAQGLLASSFNEPFQVLGFSVSEAGVEVPFAAFIFKIIEEKNKRNRGKWHKFGKLNLFGR